MTTKPICIKISSPGALSLVNRLQSLKKASQEDLSNKKETYFPTTKEQSGNKRK